MIHSHGNTVKHPTELNEVAQVVVQALIVYYAYKQYKLSKEM